jgi:hypothetical protein
MLPVQLARIPQGRRRSGSRARRAGWQRGVERAEGSIRSTTSAASEPMRTKPLAITLGLVLASASTAEAQPKRVAPFEQPFAVAMMVTDPEIVVARHGPFELLARCFPSPASGFPRSRLVIRSSVADWALTQAIDPTRTNLLGLPAGEEPIGGITVSAPEIVSAFGGSAMAPDGSVLTVDGARVTIGMLILPGIDCAFAGVATLLRCRRRLKTGRVCMAGGPVLRGRPFSFAPWMLPKSPGSRERLLPKPLI